MVWQFNPYAVPLLITAAFLISFTLIAARRRTGIALTLFVVFMLDIAALCISYALELLSADPLSIYFWARTEYLFSTTIPVLWLLFVLAYTRHSTWITPARIAMLLAIPLIHTALVATNHLHHLNWTSTGVTEVEGLILFARTYGPAFWMGSLYLYTIMMFSVILLVTAIRQAPKTFRAQLIPLLIGSAFPWVAGLVSLTPLNPLLGLDLLPFGLGLTCATIGWSVLRFRLLDLVPAAYDLVISSMSDAVIVLDARDQVIDVNPAGMRLLELPASQIIGRYAQHMFADRPLDVLPLLNSWETTGEFSANLNGTIQHFDVRISPLRDYRRQYTGRVIVIRNNSDQKRAEDTIRRYARELEERNRDLDSFSDTVAHDLRAPLHLVIGYMGLLLDFETDSMPPGMIKYLMEVQHAGYKMNEMVQSLLVLSRLRDVQREVKRVPIGPIVRAAIARYHDRVRQRGIQISIHGELPVAIGHTTWVEEVFANLIGNAISYIGNDNAEPRISIRGSVIGDYVRYEVQDNGVGIRPEVQAQLFHAYKRFHQQEETGGFGMGLAIVNRIVTRLQGEVGVESEPGQGSTFWFTLPAVAEPAATLQPDASPTP